MQATRPLLTFNRGIVSPLALARVDLKRLQLSAEIQRNWMPRVLGPMMFRPGWEHVGNTRGDLPAKLIEFVYSGSFTAKVELTDLKMRVWIDDEVVRRGAVTATFTRWNGGDWIDSADTVSTFDNDTDLGYWKDNDEAGATSTRIGPTLILTGTGRASAIRDRAINVHETTTEHSINIEVDRGSVMMRIGSTLGAENVVAEKELRTGVHSIGFTPHHTRLYLRLSNSRATGSIVDNVAIAQAAADMTLDTPWAHSDLQYVRWHQEGDIIFVACRGRPPKRIERQGSDSPRSWSVVEYAPEDGPFRDLNTGPIRIKASGLTGDIILTAERPFFRAGHVPALFSLTSSGQQVEETFTADEMATDPIRIVGVGAGRDIQVVLSGTYAAGTRIVLQRSIAEPGAWTDVTSWTAATTDVYNDALDNQIIYYRLWTGLGDYASPDAVVGTLTAEAGSITGVVRLTGITSSTSVFAAVITPLGRAEQYTQDWREGDWSPRHGYPSALAMFDGRLFWFGKGFEWGSVPDQFDSFDDTIEGDSAPIRRSIGAGPIDDVNWGLSVDNLLIGLEGSIVVARSSSLDEPLTQTKFGLKPVGDMGTAAVPALRADTSAIFVGGNGCRLYEIAKSETGAYPPPDDLTALVPEIAGGGFIRRAYQRFPDRRLHLVRSDGTVAILVFDKLEQVKCWVEVETDGFVEDVMVLPGAPGARTEDRVYYVVRRTVGGVTKRFLEKWATEDKAIGAPDTRLMDCHIAGHFDGNEIIDIPHLEGCEVALWGNNKDLGVYTVEDGQITSSEPIVGPYCAGLAYEARFKSAKRAIADQVGDFLTKHKKITSVGLLLANTHAQGLRYGEDFVTMDDLPMVEDGAEVPDDTEWPPRGSPLLPFPGTWASTQDTVWAALDSPPVPFPGTWRVDPRLCLVAASPRPCTVLGVVLLEESGG